MCAAGRILQNKTQLLRQQAKGSEMSWNQDTSDSADDTLTCLIKLLHFGCGGGCGFLFFLMYYRRLGQSCLPLRINLRTTINSPLPTRHLSLVDHYYGNSEHVSLEAFFLVTQCLFKKLHPILCQNGAQY